MKKVYFLLAFIGVLSLLDGTPIHYCHGKYLAVRTKSSFQQVTAISSPQLSNAVIEDDQSEDDNEDQVLVSLLFTIIPENGSLVTSPEVAVDHHYHPRTIPVYQLTCDFRI